VERSSLFELVKTEAGAYLAEKHSRVRFVGSDVLIEPTAISGLALVLHELITNAAKYAALSDN
jgi:two-component sensor histidine kinase